jgi:hypothetical protein
MFVAAMIVGGLGGNLSTALGADDAVKPAVPAEKAAEAPAKQWVWLKSQGCWGYGFQREDGLWVVDAGSKRKPAEGHSDLGGFLGWLNATRASHGLAAVGHDPNLTSWAAVNNSHQQARGMGHFVMGPATRQNCAMGSAGSIGSQWMNSPAHRAAMLDPSVRWIGLAGVGAYWTLNMR